MRIASQTGQPASEAERLIGDIAAWFNEPIADYVRRRHATLALTGMKNPQIFSALTSELSNRPFAAPAMSDRQVRRVIYG